MNRGSEWRKWDLHIHTPGTAKNDNYGNSDEVWERYIDAFRCFGEIGCNSVWYNRLFFHGQLL